MTGAARLFVAVWPPPEVIEVLEGLGRPDRPGVRWTRPEHWHVTLRFLGPAEADPVVAAVSAAASAVRPAVAVAGPATRALGRGVLSLPVAGLEALASEVLTTTSGLGAPPGSRPFHGHLTLARCKGGPPKDLVGRACSARWRVEDVAVVRSVTGGAGVAYETVASAALGGSTPTSPTD